LWISSLVFFSALLFTRHTVGNFSGGIDVAAADLDGDGDIDIVGAAALPISWFGLSGGGLITSCPTQYLMLTRS
jgi:hypothetical protein